VAGELPLGAGAEELRAYSRRQLDRCREMLAGITGTADPRSPENTLRPFNELSIELGEVSRLVSLLRSVHPDAACREAAERCEQEIDAFSIRLSLDRPLYEAVRASSPDGLDAVGVRFREHLLRDFHRAGVDREEAVRLQVERLKNDLVALRQEFARNILGDVRAIELDGPHELEGLPEDYVRTHPPDARGKIRITTEYPDYNPFMAYARSAERREELYRAFRRRAHPQNAPVLKAILERRHELASLLGYESWADLVTEDKMIKNGKAVGEFIERVARAAAGRSQEEYDRLLARKRRDEPGASEVHDWEKGYYEELLRLEEFDIDSRQLRPYFPYRAVKEGVLDLASSLFGIEFRPRPDALRWHADVEVFDVIENRERVGRVYLDMFQREGKFKHAAMFPLIQGVRGRRRPQAALVCNFRDAETLLEHDDVVTFFHEFGHLLHHLFARELEWVEFSGTGTEWDFVEVPSQLFEEWAWEPAALARFARHHETGEVIPAGLVERLREAKDFGLGLQVRQQMFYASLSLKCHERDLGAIEIEELLRELQNRYSRFRFVEDTYFHTSFGHLDTYSAVYYTYMWSLVIEKDISGVFKERGMMDRDTAERYRRTILAPGGSRDAAELVTSFLGREYGFEAFERWLDGREGGNVPGAGGQHVGEE
jgi:thimet oligopeptidase